MSPTRVADLTTEELEQLIQYAVKHTILDLLKDPDVGLELRQEIIERLEASFAREQDDEALIPASEVAAELGLEGLGSHRA